ncbi:MAG: T9SS type A sorting domain-containing protein, partial [Crocinitomicaceae bacterium]|nr:T9SS type A sorting domain-containing protein [Crocinitomicaceae bacterium]
ILSKSYGTITCDNCSNGDLNWYADDVIFSTDDQHSISSWNGTTYENGLFRVTETNQWSCTTSSASTLVYQPYFSQNIETGCAPLEVLYENLTDPVEGIHCTLTINDVEEPFDSPFLHTFNDPGIYTSILFAQVGEELFSYSQETHILTAVIPELSIETDGTLVCTNCEGNGTVNWYYNGELIATNVYEIDIETPGQFEVELTSTGGCSGSSILNGIEEISNGYIILYPNPATETIQIRSSGVTDNYEIYDSSGRLVGKNSPRASGFAVDISFLDNGFYTMILENAGEIRSMRFMVMR